MNQKKSKIAVACSARGAGNDPEPLRRAFHLYQALHALGSRWFHFNILIIDLTVQSYVLCKGMVGSVYSPIYE